MAAKPDRGRYDVCGSYLLAAPDKTAPRLSTGDSPWRARSIGLAEAVCILCPWRLLARLLGVQFPRPACPPCPTVASTCSWAVHCDPSPRVLAELRSWSRPALRHMDDRTTAYLGL